MPISTFTQISLSQIFQELPSLVPSHGLFVDVNGFSHAASYVGDITLRVTTYTGTHGRLKESRLQRKMLGLPAAPNPCTYCRSPCDKILAPDTCPLCLTPTAMPGWIKETTTVQVRVHHTGKIELSSWDRQNHNDIIAAFLQPLFTQQVKRYEERGENIERVAAAAAAQAEAAKDERKRRMAISERA
jgi:hypothetical protein